MRVPHFVLSRYIPFIQIESMYDPKPLIINTVNEMRSHFQFVEDQVYLHARVENYEELRLDMILYSETPDHPWT